MAGEESDDAAAVRAEVDRMTVDREPKTYKKVLAELDVRDAADVD